MSEDYLIVGGGALKSLSDSGKVGGHLVLYDDVDLQEEFFTRKTDFWLEGKSFLPLIFAHGRSPQFGRKKLTHVRWENQYEGLWVEGRLPIKESAKIEALWEAVKRDELGLSSGSAGHLVERVKRAHATEIVTWPLSEASLSPNPCQPKSRAIALKSLPVADFDLYGERQPSAEQRAYQIYAELLQSQHEMLMREIEIRNR